MTAVASSAFGATPAPLAALLGMAGVCITALGAGLLEDAARGLTEWWATRRALRRARRSNQPEPRVGTSAATSNSACDCRAADAGLHRRGCPLRDGEKPLRLRGRP